jgi:hypothetical protein
MHARCLHGKRLSGLIVPAVLIVLAVSACVPRKPAPEAPEPAPLAQVDPDAMDVNTAYSEGMQAFWTGNFKTAAVLFENLAGRVDEQTFRARALYGLACARLAGAQNQADMDVALAVWQEWQVISTGSADRADPRMLTPFLRNPRIFNLVKEPRDSRPQPARQTAGEQDLAKRLQDKEKQVLLLQKQIKALEAIHQEIQEKKKMSNQ